MRSGRSGRCPMSRPGVRADPRRTLVRHPGVRRRPTGRVDRLSTRPVRRFISGRICPLGTRRPHVPGAPCTRCSAQPPHHALLERCSATPSTAQQHLEWAIRANYAWALPSIQCPTEVLHQPDSLFAREAVRRVAELIPNGRFHDLPPIPAGATLGEALIPVLDHVEELATGAIRPVDADRFLATILFTDVVRSTDLLAQIGDIHFASCWPRTTDWCVSRSRRARAHWSVSRVTEPERVRRSGGRHPLCTSNHPDHDDSRVVGPFRCARRNGHPRRPGVDRDDGAHRRPHRLVRRARAGPMLTAGARSRDRRRHRFHGPGQPSTEGRPRPGPDVHGDEPDPAYAPGDTAPPDPLRPRSPDHGAPLPAYSATSHVLPAVAADPEVRRSSRDVRGRACAARWSGARCRSRSPR